MKYNFVYKTTNNLNGDYYYGVHSTDNLNDGYMGSGKRIKRSINKYGKENFTREIVQFFSSEKCAYSLEKSIVTQELIADKHCLNIAIGGYGGNVLAGYTEEQRKERGAKISKGNKGHSTSDITRKKISKANKGRKHTEESRKHMSDGQKGKSMLEETKDKLRKSFRGRKFINNGTINKQVKESELSLFLNNGWQIGRIKN